MCGINTAKRWNCASCDLIWFDLIEGRFIQIWFSGKPCEAEHEGRERSKQRGDRADFFQVGFDDFFSSCLINFLLLCRKPSSRQEGKRLHLEAEIEALPRWQIFTDHDKFQDYAGFTVKISPLVQNGSIYETGLRFPGTLVPNSWLKARSIPSIALFRWVWNPRYSEPKIFLKLFVCHLQPSNISPIFLKINFCYLQPSNISQNKFLLLAAFQPQHPLCPVDNQRAISCWRRQLHRESCQCCRWELSPPPCWF